MKRTPATLLVLLMGAWAWHAAQATDEVASPHSAADAKNRSARAQFNAAIARKDLAAISGFLAPSYHIVTGRSAQSHGAAAEVDSWRAMFLADPSFVCERTPADIAVNDGWGLAQELGQWVCDYHADREPVRSKGVYAAKWQRAENGVWLLQAEVFTTLECRGPAEGCRAPDRIAE